MYFRPETNHYPYQPHQIRQDFPYTSFPATLSDSLLAEYGIFTVAETDQPTIDTMSQRVSESPPIEIDGVWTQQWGIIDLSPEEAAANFANLIATSCTQIDGDTDAIYGAVLGSRAQEYTLAEQEAAAYTAAGHTGTVPSSVQAWATAKGWAAHTAADDILATATAWRGAQAAIRAQRLAAKEAVRNADDLAEVTAALAAWGAFATYIRGQLA